MTKRITSRNITELQENEIFVFGSNGQGNHIGGAAKVALEKFGAIQGQSTGSQGQSYAINTMDGIDIIKPQINEFVEFAKEKDKDGLIFLVTEIGCGIAGFTPQEIAPLFEIAKNVNNIYLPQSFWDIIGYPSIKGFKVFNSDFTCRDVKYEVGKEYKMDEKPIACERGYHFCLKAQDCFSYYSFDSKNIVCEVEALGDIATHSEDSKIATNHLKIIRKLDWREVLLVANSGSNNTGYRNSGDRNSGNWNSGNWNSGDSNSGYRNSGNWNSGDRNSGDRNSGYRNSGYRNSGDRNSGNWNSGNWNSGDSNSGYRNSGAFCTEQNPTIYLFNKPTKMKVKEWENHQCYRVMRELLDFNLWIPSYKMTDKEKLENSFWETTEGYLKTITLKEAWGNMWGNLSKENKKAFLDLPNFDAEIFEEITGIDVNKK